MATSQPPARLVILVVEDEPLLRLLAVDLIETAMFEVVEACDADQAIEILMARTDIRIVFTDIDMPGSMNGLKLAAAIRSRWPPIDIIVTSGKVDPPPGAIPARGKFFSKPYSEKTLIRAIREFAA